MTKLVKWVANYTQVVAPTTLSSISCVVFKRRPIGKIHAFVMGNGTLYIAQSRDSFTYTAGTSLSYPSRVFDEDTGTYGSASITGPVSETEILRIDYSSVANRLIYVKIGADNYTKLRVYASSDGVSWTNIFGYIQGQDPFERILLITFRYIKVTYENTNSGVTGTGKIYEVWAVSTANCYSITSTLESGVQKLSVVLPVYFVFVVPTADTNTTYAIYEENVPASVQGVVIE